MALFQFHNGTIRAGEWFRTFKLGANFQFHNGTIRALALLIVLILVPPTFNSTMVRLELVELNEGSG